MVETVCNKCIIIGLQYFSLWESSPSPDQWGVLLLLTLFSFKSFRFSSLWSPVLAPLCSLSLWSPLLAPLCPFLSNVSWSEMFDVIQPCLVEEFLVCPFFCWNLIFLLPGAHVHVPQGLWVRLVGSSGILYLLQSWSWMFHGDLEMVLWPCWKHELGALFSSSVCPGFQNYIEQVFLFCSCFLLLLPF